MKIASFDVGEKNFAYCIGHNDITMSIKKIVHVNIIESKKQTVIESCIKISKLLDEDKDIEDCTNIIIEQQMGSNIRAQKIAQHLWTYFYTKYSKKISKKIITFIPSRFKTQYFLNKNELNYKKRKNWAIEKVLNNDFEEIKIDENIINQINNLNKKDDICDTILQFIVYVLHYTQRR